MIDVHCHILPGVDDGAETWDMTLDMCRIAKKDGITHIVATPHANSQFPFHREKHAEQLEELREKIPDIEFSLGCDFHASYENVSDAERNPGRYTIAGGQYLLVEFSDFQVRGQMAEILFRLHSAGLETIVTHPERNPVIAEYPDLPEQFVSMGARLQITAAALVGEWGRQQKKTCETLLRKGLVSVIATDAHEARRRKPVLSTAREAASRLIGWAAAIRLVDQNPQAIVNNEPFPRFTS
jgi:protein-tyrosine phosphatase